MFYCSWKLVFTFNSFCFLVLLEFQSKRLLESHKVENFLERDDVNIQLEIEYVQVIKRNDEIDFSISYRQIRDRSRKSTDTERKKRSLV